MIARTPEELRDSIDAIVVELRGVAQPHEIAQLRELALDAYDADTPEQLEQIAKQVEALRAFCMNRALSAEALRLGVPRGR